MEGGGGGGEGRKGRKRRNKQKIKTPHSRGEKGAFPSRLLSFLGLQEILSNIWMSWTRNWTLYIAERERGNFLFRNVSLLSEEDDRGTAVAGTAKNALGHSPSAISHSRSIR